jgi:hypothetical protein
MPESLPCPVAAEDGRPYVRWGLGEPAVWLPAPVRDGDLAYCEGFVFGTFGGTDAPGQGWVETPRTSEMPPRLREIVLATMACEPPLKPSP